MTPLRNESNVDEADLVDGSEQGPKTDAEIVLRTEEW